MQLFSGLDRTDYQDVLRALGLYLDQERLKHIRIVEIEGGLVVQGIPAAAEAEPRVQTALLGDDQLRELLRQAYARRAPALPVVETTTPPLLVPQGEVLFRPGWTALSVTFRNVGAGPAQALNIFARWRNMALAGTLPVLDSAQESAIVLERGGAEAEAMLAEQDDAVLRIRVLYRDRVGNQYDLHCDYGFKGGGWRITRVPAPRSRPSAGTG